MTHSRPARIATQRIALRRRRAVGALLAIVALGAALGAKSPVPPSLTLPSLRTASPAAAPLDHSRDEHGDALGEAGGAVPDGTTVFADDVPGVARLDGDLLDALRRAATEAEYDGIEFVVDSGWRSRAYQQRLLDEAVQKYGSRAQAARWVATPSTSEHVSGHAVDIGPSNAAAWLSAHGSAYGLCQIYDNEPWHYELRPDAAAEGCPSMYADPTHDPRMEQ